MRKPLETPISAETPPIPAEMDRARLDDMTHRIIGAAQTVNFKLGQGFLEKVYENALAVELRKHALGVVSQPSVTVMYEGVAVGEYIPDLIVEDEIVLEIKTVSFLERAHRLQCINYLRATGLRICLLFNFGQRRLEVRRLVMKF